ncbi:MAG: hypothetical protein AAF710_10140 [Planctomycetota bacterium]
MLGVLGVLCMAGGCGLTSGDASGRGVTAAPEPLPFDAGPLLDARGHHRSLATDSPAMTELIEMQPWLAAGTPWYAGRNDRRPAVDAGVVFPVVVFSETDTSDRFSSSNGRVTDNFNVRISREKFIEVRR